MRVAGIQADVLKQYIERVERLESERAEIQTNIRDIFSAAKSDGFEPKIMKQIIKLRKMEPQEVDEQDMLLTTYQRALGMLPELDD
jgi:uncharacterized protein (UPF0335 family)